MLLHTANTGLSLQPVHSSQLLAVLHIIMAVVRRFEDLHCYLWPVFISVFDRVTATSSCQCGTIVAPNDNKGSRRIRVLSPK